MATKKAEERVGISRMSDGAILIPLAQIKNKFDVRLALNQDRVVQFAGMYEAGMDLPAIEVVQLDEDEYAFVDGRHRAEARRYLNMKNVMAIVRNGDLKSNPAALYALALQANWGGSQPPTRSDIQHTVLRMLESGVSRKDIESVLAFIPRGSLRAYTAHALNRMNRRRVGEALDAIAEGATIEEAAKKASVKTDVLKDVVAGKKGKWGKNRSEEGQLLVELKVYISQQLFSANAGISKKLTELILKVADGEISSIGASTVIKAWKDHLRKTGLRIADWEARLAAVGEPAKVEELKPVEVSTNGHKKEEKTKPARTKAKPETDPKEYAGVRMPQGFWNEELPKAIRATREKTAAPLVRYFADHGKTFTFKQVDGALQRLRLRGMA